MTKNATDLILRDRLQFTLSAAGDQATVYGRFDLSDYVNALERKGLSIKETHFMLRYPLNGTTGNFNYTALMGPNTSGNTPDVGDLKLWATTRAYESAIDVGIASPDVVHIETWQSVTGPSNAVPDAQSSWNVLTHNVYGAGDLHPSGFPVVTDLLIGVASDNWISQADAIIELDVMLVASPITITQKQLTEMLVQGQDQ